MNNNNDEHAIEQCTRILYTCTRVETEYFEKNYYSMVRNNNQGWTKWLPKCEFKVCKISL